MGKGQRPVHVAVLKKSDRTMQVSLEHCASQTEAHVVLYVFVCQRGCHSEWICAAKCRFQQVAVEDVAAQTEVTGSVTFTKTHLLGVYRYGGFLKRGYPRIIHFHGIFHYKPSIWGYPHLWKPPYMFLLYSFVCFIRRTCMLHYVFFFKTVFPVSDKHSVKPNVLHPKTSKVWLRISVCHWR
jgi:hypothetical protein